MNIRNLSKVEAAWVIGGLAIIVIMLVGVLFVITDDKEPSGGSVRTAQTMEERLEEKFNKAGLVSDYDGAAYETADAVCLDSAAGMYPHSIARSITRSNYRVSDDQAEEVVKISIQTLCPKFSDRIPATNFGN